jgi:hypothetical protein
MLPGVSLRRLLTEAGNVQDRGGLADHTGKMNLACQP